MDVVVGDVGDVGFSSLPSAAAAAVVVVGEVGAAPAPAAVGEEEGGAEKNDVMLFCFCFLPVEEAAGRAPGNLRLRGADIFWNLLFFGGSVPTIFFLLLRRGLSRYQFFLSEIS